MKNLKIWSLALTLLIAMVGCEKGGDDKVDGGNTTPKGPFKPVAVTELAEKIVGTWELKQYADQPADFDVFIEFRADASYDLYERAYGHTFEFREGTYTLDGDSLTGVYVTGDKWNNNYTIKIAENPARLRLYEESGVYAEYEAVEELPAYVVANAPVWDGKYRMLPSVAADGYVEITHPGEFATLLAVTEYITEHPNGNKVENISAKGLKVKLMKDLYFNDIALEPIVDIERFRDFEFDGNGFCLYGLNIKNTGAVAAIFPEVVDAKFSNLTINGITVDAGEGENAYAGALLGVTYGDVVVENVVVKNATIKGTNKVGGLIGFVAENSIVVKKSGVVESTIETYNVTDESGLAGGLIGYISCEGDEDANAVSKIESCEVSETTFNVINSRDSEARANSEFIGGVGGDKGDELIINRAKVANNTFTETGVTNYEKLHNLVGGIRGEFNLSIDDLAFWNGYACELPKANANGVIELTKPGEFATLVKEGVPAKTGVVLKKSFNLRGNALTPVADKEKFTELVFDGANKTISNFTITTEGTVAALFPEVVDGKFSNLTISKATVDAGVGEAAYAGALLGITYGDVVLNNIKVSESTVKGTNKVGGVIGSVMENSITATKCVVTKSTIETHELTDESGLAGGLIGYIACEGDDDVDSISKVESCEVTESKITVINSRDSAARANSEFIGAVGGDKGDELIINKANVDKNTFTETGASTYKKLHDLVGGIRGEFKITVDSEVILASEEDKTEE